MGKNKLAVYCRFAWPEIKKLFWDGADMKTVINLFIGGVFILGTGNLIKIADYPIINEIENQIFGIAPYIIAAVGYVLFNVVFIIPYKYINRLGGFVEEPIEIELKEIYDFTGGNDFTVSSKVFTTTPFRVENCTLKLVDVKNVENEKPIQFFEENLKWNRKEGNVKENKPKTIFGNGSYRICNFARWQENSGKAYFELWNSSFVEIPVGEYVCVIRINGTWEKHDINYEINVPIGFDGKQLFFKKKN